jgi:hypothetical protein
MASAAFADIAAVAESVGKINLKILKTSSEAYFLTNFHKGCSMNKMQFISLGKASELTQGQPFGNAIESNKRGMRAR